MIVKSQVKFIQDVKLGRKFWRGKSVFRKTGPETAVCLYSGHDGDIVGENYRFGYSVVIATTGFPKCGRMAIRF